MIELPCIIIYGVQSFYLTFNPSNIHLISLDFGVMFNPLGSTTFMRATVTFYFMNDAFVDFYAYLYTNTSKHLSIPTTITLEFYWISDVNKNSFKCLRGYKVQHQWLKPLKPSFRLGRQGVILNSHSKGCSNTLESITNYTNIINYTNHLTVNIMWTSP